MESSDLIFNGVKDIVQLNGSNSGQPSETVKDKVWFIGLWARYYIPWGGNFAMFLEGSGGYAVFSKEYEIMYS